MRIEAVRVKADNEAEKVKAQQEYDDSQKRLEKEKNDELQKFKERVRVKAEEQRVKEEKVEKEKSDKLTDDTDPPEIKEAIKKKEAIVKKK